MIKCSKKKLRNDVLLIGGILLLVGVVALCFHLFGKKGDIVRVTVNRNLFGVYDLNTDCTQLIVTGEHGEYENYLVIEQGVAYVKSANCPDGICMNHKPVSKNGESIICLPHGVVIAVESAENNNQADIVV